MQHKIRKKSYILLRNRFGLVGSVYITGALDSSFRTCFGMEQHFGPEKQIKILSI